MTVVVSAFCSGGAAFEIFTVKIFTLRTIIAMNAYVTYNTKYKVLICRQHKYGIARDNIGRHFRRHHQSVPVATRNAIVDYFKNLDLAAQENITMAGETVHAIEGLTVVDGYQCLYHDCSELRGTYVSMKEHCKKEHGCVTTGPEDRAGELRAALEERTRMIMTLLQAKELREEVTAFIRTKSVRCYGNQGFDLRS